MSDLRRRSAETAPHRRVRLEQRLFRAVFAAAARGPRSRRTAAVVLAVHGKGNIGDQAMLDSCTASLGLPLDVVVRDTGDLALDASATEVALPNLLYGSLPLALLEAVRLARRVRRARTVVIMGADVMDGAYSDVASSRRFLVADAASRVTDARVVGFSFNEHPRDRSAAALEVLDPRVRLIVRDGKSFARLAGRTPARLQEAADLVFALEHAPTHSEITSWIDSQRLAGRRIAAINVNALIESRQPHLVDLVDEARRLIDTDCAVVAVPHTRTDVELADRLAARLGSPHARAAPLLTPGGILGVVERTDLVITGRMHLAILALSSGVPVVSIAYQGKVEGLFEALGIQRFVLEPEHVAALPSLVDSLLADLDTTRATIASNLPHLRRASARNLAGVA